MGKYQEVKVGFAAEVEGDAIVTRADGSTSIIQKGTLIYENDTIETSEQGAVNITFNDGTIFAISQDASMVIDEYVYDANKDGEGDLDISVARGVFAYTSGFIGHEDPQDVNIDTPVGSIGIRGTIFTASIPAENSGEDFKVSILEGAIAVKPKSGGEFILDDPLESLEINPITFKVTEVGILTPDVVMESFNVIQPVAPQLLAPIINESANKAGSFNLQQGQEILDDAAKVLDETNFMQEEQLQEEGGVEPDQVLPDGSYIETDEIILNEEDLGLEQDGLLQNDDSILDPNPIDGTLGPQGPLDQSMSPDGIDPLGISTTQPDDGNTTTSDPAAGGTTTDTFDPSTSGGAAVNQAPIATPGIYHAFEQAGLSGGTHNFNISRFFSDPDGDPLSYAVTGASNGGVLANNLTIIGGNVFFSIAGGINVDTSLGFTVTATDGQSTVSKNFQTDIYKSVPKGVESTGNDTLNITGNTYSTSTRAGDDTISMSTDNNKIFGDLGNDMFTVSGNNNKSFGEAGNDTLTITSGANHTISGGAGEDTLSVDGAATNFQIFGGDGSDLISLDASALASFISPSSSVIDGGRGPDKLEFTDAGSIDLSGVNNQSIISIEKFDIANGSANTLKLDINDVFSFTGRNALFIEADSIDTIQLLNTGTGAGGLSASQTNVTNPFDPGDGNSYAVYSFVNSSGNTTSLYVSDPATVSAI